MRSKLITLVLAVFTVPALVAQDTREKSVIIIDSRHYSHVFAEMRNFRIFLPAGYHNSPNKKYPVIYFMHGWSQRYFGSGGDSYSEYDEGSDNDGDNIANFVSQHDVIVVKSDGYNRSSDEAYYVRPYNIGPVENYRQFPIYYPELIEHIDRTYHTIPDRGHRAICGLSMGGFMSFFIGGKYPHLFSGVGSFCGSPEFVIGPRDMPVEYRHMDMYQNYHGMNVRLHYGDQDFIRGYHEDLNRVWIKTMDQYSFKIFPGDEHTTSGLGEMFEFLLQTFNDSRDKPERWDHIDIYPNFSVWDYQVISDRGIPGFTLLEDVDVRGFTSTVREFLPGGSALPHVNLSILTPAIYLKDHIYEITDYDATKGMVRQYTTSSDELGRIKITCNGSIHHVGINQPGDGPNIALIDYAVEGMDLASVDRDIHLSINLLNKGALGSGALQMTLSSRDEHVNITSPVSSCAGVPVNSIKASLTPFEFQVQGDSEIVRLSVEITDGEQLWHEEITLRIQPALSEISDYIIADGGIYTVAKSGNDIETVKVGRGNADGIPNPGEFIELLVKDGSKYWRTQVWTKDNYLNPFGIRLRKSDNWGSYDHVGGSAKNSITVISSDCPQNRQIAMAVEYWLPNYPLHTIKKGQISLKVEGSDQTPPEIAWVQVPGDNILMVKIHDGAPVISARATLIDKSKNSFTITLNDLGTDGDKAANDQVFSATVPSQQFGSYRVIIEALDSNGNQVIEEVDQRFILH
ncbi:MAG: hypothetical protein HKN76_18110 [Saprospiraceae bacterium]|nr:hypothetical protein [Saprospiraceae bacterium]